MLAVSLFIIVSCFELSSSHTLRFQADGSLVRSVGKTEDSKIKNLVSHFHQSPVRETSAKSDEQIRDDLISYVKNPVSKFLLGNAGCFSCKLLVGLVQELVSQKTSEEDIRIEIERLCVIFGIEDERVCEGVSHEFKAEVLTVFDQLVLGPSEVCSVLLDDCGEPYDPLDNWNITLPSIPKPPVQPILPPKTGSPTIRILQLSDIHLDVLYKPSSNAECDEPLCCRPDDGVPAKGVPGAGQWGDYRHCDTPIWTLQNMFEHLANISNQFDYVFWTGDLPAHNIWNQSRADQIQALLGLTNMFKKYLPDKKIFSALGNHESSPVNSFPPPFITGSESISWLYDALAEDWSHWLPNNTKATIKQGAFYEVSPFAGHRIISINSNFCNNQNWWLLLNTTDPAGQLQWLINILQQAENNKEKVHIIGHIPPGVDDCLRAWSWNYYKIVNRYESTIVAQFFGHTHKDHFEVFYDEKTLKRPVNVAYISPSVTPFSFLNPGFRIYTIDGSYNGSSWAVLDHETYLLNLTAANLYNEPKWTLEYSAKKDYGMPSLNPTDWNNLINKMSTNSTLLNQFYRYFFKSRTEGICDDDCRKKMLCDLRSGRSHDKSLCIF